MKVQGILILLIWVLFSGCDSKESFLVEQLEKKVSNCELKYCAQAIRLDTEPIQKNELVQCYECIRKVEQRLQRKESLQVLSAKEQSLIHDIEKMKLKVVNLRRDPSQYNLGGSIQNILSDTHKPITYRLDEIFYTLQKAPSYYDSAKDNIYKPIASKCRLAVQKQLLTMDFLNGSLPDSIRHAPLNATFKKELLQQIKVAKLSVKDYLAYCESLWFIHQDTILQ